MTTRKRKTKLVELRFAPRTGAVLLIVALGLTSVQAAIAQNADLNADLAADRVDDRREAANQSRHYLQGGSRVLPLGVSAEVPANRFSLDVTLDFPFAYNTNPGNNNGPESLHFDPSLQLDLKRRFGPTIFTGSLSADQDLYSSNHAASSSTLVGKATLDLAEPKYIFNPYLQFVTNRGFSTSFENQNSVSKDIGAGLRSSWDLAIGWLLSQETLLAHRDSDSGQDSNLLSVKVALSHKLGDSKISFAPSYRIREFERNTKGVVRKDRTLQTPIVISTKIYGVDIRFFAKGTVNHSTDSSKDSTQWDLGPVVEFVWNL